MVMVVQGRLAQIGARRLHGRERVVSAANLYRSQSIERVSALLALLLSRIAGFKIQPLQRAASRECKRTLSPPCSARRRYIL